MNKVKKDLMGAYKEEETFWSQKCLYEWLKLGDGNTKFFHASVPANRTRQAVDVLTDENGNTHREEASKGEVAVRYFTNLFKSSNPGHFEDIFHDFVPRVSAETNLALTSEVTKAEIKEALFSIKPSSAPGYDGMNALFYQRYWGIVGDQITSEVLRFFSTGIFPEEWNYTQLCLLPKIPNASKMSDLRPISLCSVLYKIISKVIVRRLQPLLPQIVSPTQTAFVSERLIIDNIAIAHELVHGLRTHPIISSEFMAIKSDMSKAFDRVEWNFLFALLSAMGFCPRWIGWIMCCVTSVSFSVLINNKSFGLIKPERGIRQGDPLSPFLFVLSTEALSHLLNRAESQKRLSGIGFHVDGPHFHHLLFADDSLFLCKASEEECGVFKEIMMRYETVAGQQINVAKSSITFGAKVEESVKGKIRSSLGISNEGGAGTYLGLPECFSGSKVQMLSYIQDQMKGRISGWFARLLSMGGKEVLLKTVAMAMPVYAMSVFKLPKSTCSSLTAAMSNFWWDAHEHKRKIHWISWKKLCLTKEQGGLGFRDIELFNQALLAKQAWRILHEPEALLARLLRSRYFSQDQFLHAQCGYRPSFAWRSLLHGRDLLAHGLRRMVGNGRSIRVWIDPWLLDGEMRIPWIKNRTFNVYLMVSDLIDFEKRDWRIDKLRDLFVPSDVDKIRKTKPTVNSDDFWVWLHNRSGVYTVKSGYWLATRTNISAEIQESEMLPSINTLKAQVWKIKTLPKIRNFLWKALSGALPVAVNLISRGMKIDSRCQICGRDNESVNHVIFICPFARLIWALTSFPLPLSGFDEDSIFFNVNYLIQSSNRSDIPLDLRRQYPWIIWLLWKSRNQLTIEGKGACPFQTVAKIKEETQRWFLAQEVECDQGVLYNQSRNLVDVRWEPPPLPWLKCNIGISWNKKKSLLGGAWVIRNDHGEVILHSRRAFKFRGEKLGASFLVIEWAIKSMIEHRFDKIIFASEDSDIFNAVLKPSAWPSFKFYALETLTLLSSMPEWSLKIEKRESNRGAAFIANSVTEYDLLQSYVARSHPMWLDGFFAHERVLSSL